MGDMNPPDAMELLLKGLVKTKSNGEMLMSLKSGDR
jgi:hypothetical protein